MSHRSIARRALLLVVPLMLVVGGPRSESCGGCYETSVAIRITRQPQGGSNVNTLTCDLTATLHWVHDGDIRDIAVAWYNDAGKHKEEFYTLRSDDDVKAITTTLSAPPGQVLDKTFWVKVTAAAPISGDTSSARAECVVR